MKRTLVPGLTIIGLIVLFGVRLLWVRASDLTSTRIMPSLELPAEHPLALETPKNLVTPPYHKPANLPGDWWRQHHPVAQKRGDFNTVECQECHNVEKYCNRCHSYVGVKSVAPAQPAPATSAPSASRPAAQ